MKISILFMVLFLGLSFMVGDPSLYANPGQDIDLIKMKKEEEERRKKTKKSKYNLTDEDLKKVKDEKINLTEAPEGATGTTTDTQTGKEKTEKNDPKQTEHYWRARKGALEKRIKDLEGKIKDMENELARLNNEFPGKDILSERLQMEQDIKQLRKGIENHKLGLEKLKNELINLADEARQAGVPPGWLRDNEKP